jgi:hypothetical protein
MSAQSSSMHKIVGPVRSTFGRMARTSQSFVAAARLHPAGFAVPSAVIAVAVAFVTFVTAVVLRVMPPNLFGTGSQPIIHPSASQPRHRPHQQPGLAGPPMLRLPAGSRGQGPAGSRGHSSTGSHGAGAPPVTLSTSPIRIPATSGLIVTAPRNPASGSPATTPATVSVTVGTSGPVSQVRQTATSVVRTTATTVGQAVQGVPGAIGTVTGTVGAVTGTVGAVTATAGTATKTVGLAVTAAGPAVTAAGVQVSLGSSGSAAGGSAQSASPTGQKPAATITVSGSGPAGNGSSQPVVSLPVSVPGLG